MHPDWIIVLLGGITLFWAIGPREYRDAALLFGFGLMALGMGVVFSGMGGKSAAESLLLDGLVSVERFVILGYALLLAGAAAWRRAATAAWRA